MSHSVFTYGTLMFPEVMESVCGRLYDSEPATLTGYTLTTLHDREYPGIIPELGARCQGLLYSGVDDQALALLDEFEGDEYERLTVSVDYSEERREGWTYVITAAHLSLATREVWNPAVFREKHLKSYLARI